MITISIYDETLETPFRDICETSLPLDAAEETVIKELKDLMAMHKRLKNGETAVQRKYNDL